MTLAHQDTVVSWNEPDPVPLRGTLVVLPGRGESAQVYERFGRRIATDAYRVHVVAAPSDSAERTHDQVLGLLAAADQQTPRIVVGSDAGAAYAAHLAARADLPGATALILAGLPTSAAAAPAQDWDEELATRTTCPTHRRRISDGAVRPAELFAGLPGDWFSPSAPARIAVPVLGIHGHEDPLSPIEAARAWYSSVRTAELVTIDGGRHDVLNDQTHRTVAASVVLFLERLRAGADLAPIAATERFRAPVTP